MFISFIAACAVIAALVMQRSAYRLQRENRSLRNALNAEREETAAFLEDLSARIKKEH